MHENFLRDRMCFGHNVCCPNKHVVYTKTMAFPNSDAESGIARYLTVAKYFSDVCPSSPLIRNSTGTVNIYPIQAWVRRGIRQN